MQVCLGHQTKDFFPIKTEDKFWKPSHLGDTMTGKRFKRINKWLNLDDEKESPQHRCSFFWARKWKKIVNNNMATEFDPSWLVCIDESIVSFHNAHESWWIALNRMSYLLGNEFNAMSCCETNIILSIKLVEGTDKPKEGTHTVPEFEEEKGSKSAALLLRVSRSMRGSGRGYTLDSGFGHAYTFL